MKIAITGATGFIGTKLVTKLATENQIVIFTRNGEKAKTLFSPSVLSNLEFVTCNLQQEGDWRSKIDGCNAVINLAGAPIAERWNDSYKQEILNSRQLTTRNIVNAISRSTQKPEVLINASAIGYYGTSETETYTEISPSGKDFLAEVCQAWEGEAEKVRENNVRLVIFRLGIVLGDGGALAKMIPPFKIFAGGPIGEGKQWFSWIHQEDVINMIIEALNNHNLNGTFNATAPNPVTMNQLCETLGNVLKRPSWLPVPGFALELLLGDGAKVVLEGQKVLPEKTITEMKYNFRFSQLQDALMDINN